MVEKLERQMSLLAALLQTEQSMTAAEIQRRVEGYPDDLAAFRRAFERDKDDFRRLGVPIEMAQRSTRDGEIDAYRVRRDEYYLHDLGLDADETVALSMALRLIRLEGAEMSDTMWKLGGASAETAPEIAAMSMGPAVAELHQASRRRVSVRFQYRGEARLVEPWRVSFRRGHWYLHGWDVDRNDSRSFRLDRVDGALHVDDRPATEPRGVARGERQPWEFGDDDDVEIARVAVDASHAGWVRQQLGSEAVVASHPDGSVEVELHVANRVGFRNFVLSMLDAAEVLGPDDLRSDVVTWLEAQVQ